MQNLNLTQHPATREQLAVGIRDAKKDGFIRTSTVNGTPVSIRISNIDLFYEENGTTTIILKDGIIVTVQDSYGELNKLI